MQTIAPAERSFSVNGLTVRTDCYFDEDFDEVIGRVFVGRSDHPSGLHDLAWIGMVGDIDDAYGKAVFYLILGINPRVMPGWV